MSKAENGRTVKVHYTGKLEDGSVFDSSRDREPLEFTVGEHRLIPGFEKAVEGMEVGDTKTVTIEKDDAYGPRRDDLVFEVQKGVLPEDLDPQVGQMLHYKQEDGPPVPLTITDVKESTVTLDGNHPLAGKDLTFELELVEVG
ncbi:MAG: peptidylprolyl isomerase [Gemmatimonadetes bacterium]|uniref:Peptidyl-prolyl cis-trans isomerase n=1 Tax=Candidatus Kutchimonas denitrificans TaxID=3056748 RepID=A0AAE4ZAL8_9BACT|nr:peptidylprolyl isomerase [Gemmatimonadota bacterium]NIR75622.1 peptidylprolyl isomerase [Candidatus Kutchimonas denitrificans]NIS02923.1 peptidylprolyl isomerase [Gemmatimonadota bacterium]NIT68645.1 peptidylprolyl isomerase [Gemmatimonadota bacterium]NIV25324.1 peptidylprolyl isomerase [Gemmatimonadota bacterium]